MVSFLRKLNLWLIFFTLLAYIAPYISPETVSLLMFVGLSFPWLLLFNLIFIGLWALSRMQYWWWSALVLVVGWQNISRVFGLNIGQYNYTYTPSENSVRVMTYNVGELFLPTYKNKPLGYKAFGQFLQNEDAEILCVNEFLYMNLPNYMKYHIEFLKTYNHHYGDSSNQVAIFSKYPIINKGFIAFPNSDNVANSARWADIDIKGKIVRVFAVHLQSNFVSDLEAKVAKTGSVSDADSWLKVFKMLKMVRKMSTLRAKQAEIVAENIKKSPYPVIVCGDFNDIPVSYSYNTIADGLDDAFQKAGLGKASTYNGRIPALKIDNILINPKIKALNTRIEKVYYADHFPMIADLDLSNL